MGPPGVEVPTLTELGDGVGVADAMTMLEVELLGVEDG